MPPWMSLLALGSILRIHSQLRYSLGVEEEQELGGCLPPDVILAFLALGKKWNQEQPPFLALEMLPQALEATRDLESRILRY